ncbi:MAG: kelch repeat-containing protein [Planctomycetota bacterium]
MRAALSLLVLAAAPAAQTWQFVGSTDGSKPTKRHEAAYVEVGGKFYLMGGRGSRPVEEFDPVTETWTDLGLPPLQMHHFQPVVWGGKIYAVCAFEGGYPNETAVPNIWIFDPSTAAWQMSSAIPPARNRGAAGAVVYDDFIYVVGGNNQGHNGGYVPWLDRYDPATDTWTALADAPHARDHFTAAVIGNKLYAAGGRQTEQPNPFVNTIGPVDVYDFTSGQWANMPEPIPTQRAGTMTIARDEHLVVIGGESPGTAHDETEALDVGTGEWLALPGLNQARHSGGAVLYQDHVYCAAGSGNAGGNPELDTQESLDLSTLLATSALNLVTNGDFDAGQSGWIDNGDLTLSTDGGINAPALEVENGWTGKVAAGGPQKTYLLRGVYQVFGGGGNARLGLEYLDAGGIELGETALSLDTTSAYTSFDLTGTSPLGTASVRAFFEATGGRKLRFDDVVLMLKPAEILRVGVPANPVALQPSGTGPVAGQAWSPFIDHSDFAPGAAIDLVAVGLFPVNLPTSIGTVLCDPTTTLIATSAAGVPFAIPVPSVPVTIGAQLYTQGASVDGFSTPLTNALDITILAP